LSIWKGLSSAY